jgi:flagellar biogenesis protein FliO
MEPLPTIAALAITFGLLGGLLWLLRIPTLTKFGRSAPWIRETKGKQLYALEKVVLGPDCTLHVVAFKGETMLLAVSGKTVVPIPSTAPRSESFRTAGGSL